MGAASPAESLHGWMKDVGANTNSSHWNIFLGKSSSRCQGCESSPRQAFKPILISISPRLLSVVLWDALLERWHLQTHRGDIQVPVPTSSRFSQRLLPFDAQVFIYKYLIPLTAAHWGDQWSQAVKSIPHVVLQSLGGKFIFHPSPGLSTSVLTSIFLWIYIFMYIFILISHVLF